MVPIAKLLNSFTSKPIIFKYYLISIPKWHFISRELKKYLNRFRILGRVPSDKEVLGEKTVKFIINFYQQSNSNLDYLFGREKLIRYGYLDQKIHEQ